MFLRRSIIGPKTDMTIALDSWKDREDTTRVLAAITKAGDKINTLTTHKFVGMIGKFLAMGMPERAQRIVDALSDTEPTRLGLLLLRLVGLAIVALPIAALAALILWAVQ